MCFSIAKIQFFLKVKKQKTKKIPLILQCSQENACETTRGRKSEGDERKRGKQRAKTREGDYRQTAFIQFYPNESRRCLRALILVSVRSKCFAKVIIHRLRAHLLIMCPRGN